MTAPKVSAMKKHSIFLSLSFSIKKASKITNTGVVLFTSDTITTSIYSTAIIFMRLLTVDYIDLKISGARYFRSISSKNIRLAFTFIIKAR
jgi:hypothetical protein